LISMYAAQPDTTRRNKTLGENRSKLDLIVHQTKAAEGDGLDLGIQETFRRIVHDDDRTAQSLCRLSSERTLGDVTRSS